MSAEPIPTDEELVAEFMAANDDSPVVSGAAIGNGGQGGVYTLADGRCYVMSGAICRALPEGYPRWKL